MVWVVADSFWKIGSELIRAVHCGKTETEPFYLHDLIQIMEMSDGRLHIANLYPVLINVAAFKLCI